LAQFLLQMNDNEQRELLVAVQLHKHTFVFRFPSVTDINILFAMQSIVTRLREVESIRKMSIFEFDNVVGEIHQRIWNKIK